MRKDSAHTDFSLNSYLLVIFISTLPPSLTFCILNVVDIFRDAVDVKLATTRQRDSFISAFIYTECIGKVEPATRKYFLRGKILLRPDVIITFDLFENRSIALLCM